MAILLIVMLGVGFFSGLKVSRAAMVNTADDYLTTHAFYDFRLISTLGFTEEDVEKTAARSDVAKAEGFKTVDAVVDDDGDLRAFKLTSLPDEVSTPSLDAGRMPEADNECLADSHIYSKEDIGREITVTDQEDTLSEETYTIVGIVHSPEYIGTDRGSTSVGNGALRGFFYLPKDVFSSEAFTEIQLTLKDREDIYTEAYDDLIAEHESDIAQFTKDLADARYEDLIEEAGIPEEMASRVGIEKPDTYVLTRDENSCFRSFDNDTSIVSGIANIFPVFFVLIAMLVCMTTMTRMVDEERTQIGTLKALGFRNSSITGKYMLYAGSATFLGWLIGFFGGTVALPLIFWHAYGALYDFAPLIYLFDPALALGTFAASMIGILGSTWFSCRKELMSQPAQLIRPQTAKEGKRILLERLPFIWKRLSFLRKVTLRNMFRYKKKLIMMLVGISCCTGLLITGFGVRDTMINTGHLQYDTVQAYDMEVSFTAGEGETALEELATVDGIREMKLGNLLRVDLKADKSMNSVSMYSFDNEEGLRDFWKLKHGEENLTFPDTGEAFICQKIADELELAVGDTFTIRDADGKQLEVTVGGIYDNYAMNSLILSADTYEEAFGTWEANTVLLNADEDTESFAETLMNLDSVLGVNRLAATRNILDDALSCLDYIIWIIVVLSGALAFIVMFNLTNINLAERSREIATVEVLGFYPRETQHYVLWENAVLSVLAMLLGIPLGTIFHRVVMSMIHIEMLRFYPYITWQSYLLAMVCTIFFMVFVNLFMRRSIAKIPMAESLKAVE